MFSISIIKQRMLCAVSCVVLLEAGALAAADLHCSCCCSGRCCYSCWRCHCCCCCRLSNSQGIYGFRGAKSALLAEVCSVACNLGRVILGGCREITQAMHLGIGCSMRRAAHMVCLSVLPLLAVHRAQALCCHMQITSLLREVLCWGSAAAMPVSAAVTACTCWILKQLLCVCCLLRAELLPAVRPHCCHTLAVRELPQPGAHCAGGRAGAAPRQVRDKLLMCCMGCGLQCPTEGMQKEPHWC